MEYATIIAIVVVGIVIALVVYWRKPDVQTPAAIKDIEDRLRAAWEQRMKGLEDRLHATALAVPPPAATPTPTPAPFPPPVLPYEDWVDAFGPKNGAPIWVIARWKMEHNQ